MANFTPGPWTLIGNQGTAIWAENEIIANMASPRTNHPQARANAQLIAAAPELLTVAEMYVQGCPFCESNPECFSCGPVYALIIRAGGQPPARPESV